MIETPSKRRRKGREAFDPLCNPMDLQPYDPKSWTYKFYLQDWLGGWEEARKEEENQTEEDQVCYIITKETIEKVLGALDAHCFSDNGRHNNSDVIKAENDLRVEIEGQ